MFSITPMPNGNLQVCADNAARAWIKEEQQLGRGSDDILHGGTEHYWTNGSFEPFDAGQANPFVGLTSAPCIAEHMTVRDDGEREIDGRLWWYPNYAITDPMEVLKRTGSVEFQAA
ncbi:hypothetical protein [Methylibium petroleiphilum]|uniref:Uncharacterized protein n=1 Tax=Methylibium petroleiphilum (strain ATCC BAA-1232 / LMG 22953 / PM1) TaxID=420662 RepID=A2SN59_METPP|nr:hypothetical protein [Methylibium petroleiphilum]ABM96998.1 hypothetical protein Mpe_B0223 [Methylibium petroleiphilum PM1]